MEINKLNIQLQVIMYNLKKKKIKLHISIPETRWALPFSLLRERERERERERLPYKSRKNIVHG